MSEIIKIILKSPSGQSTEHRVEKSYSLKQLKGSIPKEVGVNPLSVFRVNGKQLMNDAANLDDCEIGNDSIVQLHDGIQIYVRMMASVSRRNAETISLLVDQRDTIEMVKNLIHLKIGLRMEEQMVRFGGHLLDDDWLLSGYGIKGGNTLSLWRIASRTVLELTVVSAMDSTRLTVEPSEKVHKVAELIAAKLKNKLNQYEKIDILFKEHLLDPEKTLGECHVKDGCVIVAVRCYRIGNSALSTQS